MSCNLFKSKETFMLVILKLRCFIFLSFFFFFYCSPKFPFCLVINVK